MELLLKVQWKFSKIEKKNGMLEAKDYVFIINYYYCDIEIFS